MADFSTEEKANLLLKKYFNKSSTYNTTPYFQENPIYNARTSVFNSQIWAQSSLIPTTAPDGGTTTTSGTDDNGDTLDGSTVGKTITVGGVNLLKKYIKLQLQEVPGSNGTAFYYPDSSNNNASILKNTIPFDYDPVNSTYEYKLYKYGSNNTIINFGEGEWVLDTDTGILTFYQISGISGVSSSQPPKISFYKYIGTFGAASSTEASGNELQVSSGNAKVECIDTSGTLGDYIKIFTGENSSNEQIRIDKDGNIGIGITEPQHKLDVDGTIRVSGSFTDGSLTIFNGSISNVSFFQLVEGSGAGRILTSDAYGNASWQINTGSSGVVNVTTEKIFEGNAKVECYDTTGSDGDYIKFFTGESSSIERMIINKKGDIGIGITNPTYTLDVDGSMKLTGSFTDGTIFLFNGSITNVKSFQLTEGASSNRVLTSDSYGNATWQEPTAVAEKIYNGYAKIECFDTTGTLGDYIKLYTGDNSSNERIVIDKDGYVGIGITTPTTALDIDGSIKLTGSFTDGTISLFNGSITNVKSFQLTEGSGANKILTSDSNGYASWEDLVIETDKIFNGYAKIECFDTSGTLGDYIKLYTGDSSSNERIVIDKDGHVGIGIASPYHKLEVDGTIKASGSVTDGTLSLYNGKIVGARNIQLTQGAGINKVLTSDAYGNAIWTSVDDLNFTNGANNDGIIGSLSSQLIWSVSNVNNQEQVVIDNSGRMGIGKLNPYHRLEVNGTIKATGSFTNGILSFYHGSLTGLTSLQLVEGAGANKVLVSDDYGNATWQTLAGGSGTFTTEKIYEGHAKIECYDSSGADGDYIKFYTGENSSSERVVINKDGFVGIGVSAPTTELDINGSVKLTGSLTNGTISIFNGSITGIRALQIVEGASINKVLTCDEFGNATWQNNSGAGSVDKIIEGNTEIETIDTGIDGHIKFTTEGIERVRINKDGNVGIGISNPSYTLDVDGSLKLTGSFTDGTISLFSGSITGLKSFQLVEGAAVNKILTTDAEGNASWQYGYSVIDKISKGNTEIETIDTGIDGHIKLTTEGVERIRIDKDGNVGIGNSNPSYTLDVDGSVKLTGSFTDGTISLFSGSITGLKSFQLVEGAGANKILTSDADGNASWQVNYGGSGGAGDKIGEGNSEIEVIDLGNDGYIKFTTESVERVRIDKDGNFGIGISNPTSKLEVDGSVKFHDTPNGRSISIIGGSITGARKIQLTEGAGYNKVLTSDENGYAVWKSIDDIRYATILNGDGVFGNLSSSAIWSVANSLNQEQVVIDNSGRMGIGILNPYHRLEVNGTIKTTGSITNGVMSFFHGSLTGLTSLQLIEGAGENKVLTSDANGNASWQNYTGGNNGNVSAEKIYEGYAKIECFDTSGIDGDFIKFYTGENSSLERLVINKDGNIGVGVSNPTYKLDIDGSVKLTGSFTDGTISLFNGSITGLKSFQLVEGAGENKVLTSDANGNAVWSSISISGSVSSGFTEKIYEGYAKIECFDTSGVDGDYIRFYTGENSSNESMIINKDGNVGIGITSPTSKLDVNGNMKITGSITDGTLTCFSGSIIGLKGLQLIPGASINKVLTSDAYGNAIWKSLDDIRYGGSVGGDGNYGNISDDAIWSVTNSTNTEQVMIDDSGRMGIGILNPYHRLEVSGTIKATGSITDGTLSLHNGSITGLRGFQLSEGAGANKVLTSDEYGNASWQSNSGGGGGSVDSIYYGDSEVKVVDTGVYAYINFKINGNEKARFSNNGYFGIATTNPSTELDVNGMTKSSSLTDGTFTAFGGSITGLKSLQITDNYGINKVLTSDEYGNASWQSVSMGTALSNGYAKVDVINQNNDDYIQFFTSFENAYHETMRLDKNGNLGIGVTDPDQKLELNGILHISEEQSSTPSAPGANDGGLIYTKNDGKLYYISNNLSEYNLTEPTGGSGSLTTTLIKTNELTDGTFSIVNSSLTNFKFLNSAISSITNISYSGTISTEKFTDGTITINSGTLSCSANSGFIEANIGSFTNLYAHDLFVADDMIINGNTTYINSSQTTFEDELISLGATDGMSIASVSSNRLTIYCETEVPNSYNSSSYALLMLDNGEKNILQISSSSNNTINFSTEINVNTKFVSLISTETIADGSGIEILAHNNGNSRIKKFHYVHDNTNPTMEVMSYNSSLDLRISNLNSTNGTSYFSVLDKDNQNNNKHKQLLTSDALYLNTSNTGTITGSNESAAIYLSKNGGDNDSNGDWRFKVEGSSVEQTVIMQQFNGTSWITRWTIN